MPLNLTRLTNFQVSAETAETDYDDAVPAVDSLIKVSVGTLPNVQVALQDDADLVGGNEEPDDASISSKSVVMPIAQPRARPHTLAFVAGYAIGTAAASLVSDSLVYKHLIRATTKNTLPSFVAEGKIKTGLQKKYSGCAVDSFTLQINRGAEKWVDLAANGLASGTIAGGSATKSEPSEEALTGGNMVVFLGATTWDNVTSDALDLSSSELNGAPSDITADITSISWEFRNNVDADFNYELGAGLVFGNMYRGTRSQTVTLSVLADVYDEVDRLTGQTDLAMDVKLRGSLIENSRYYGFQLLFPMLRERSVELADDSGRLVYNIEFLVAEKGTYDSVYFDVYNKTAGPYVG